MNDPKTIPELLDAAATNNDGGQAFAQVILGMITALETMKDEETDD